MSSRKRVLKGGLKLGAGQGFSQGCSFIRNVIVARLISTADFGIAATFAITLSLIEMLSNLAADKLILQSKKGDDPGFQETLQFVQFGRGIFSSVWLFLLAGPVSRLFGVPEATWAFRWLAVIPLLRGLIHQDIYRFQRNMQFGPSILADALAIGLSTLATYPFGRLFPDYSCLLWLILLQTATLAVMSHIVAERSYRWSFTKEHVTDLYRFGWPLLLNGILLFGIMQGDRFLIGSANKLFGRSLYTLSDLGLYSVVFALTFAPTMLLSNVSIPLFLPLLSKAQSEFNVFIKRYDMVCRFITLSGGAIAIILITSGTLIIKFIYGEKYSVNTGGIVAWLGAMQAFRLIRTGPTIAAMAKGDTKNSLYSNIYRSVALVAALVVVATGGSVASIAATGFFGEFIALIYCLWRLDKVHFISPFASIKLGSITMLFMFMGYLASIWLRNIDYLPFSLLLSIAIVVCYALTSIVVFPNLKDDILSIRSIFCKS